MKKNRDLAKVIAKGEDYKAHGLWGSLPPTQRLLGESSVLISAEKTSSPSLLRVSGRDDEKGRQMWMRYLAREDSRIGGEYLVEQFPPPKKKEFGGLLDPRQKVHLNRGSFQRGGLPLPEFHSQNP